jgi:hypothetical protein
MDRLLTRDVGTYDGLDLRERIVDLLQGCLYDCPGLEKAPNRDDHSVAAIMANNALLTALVDRVLILDAAAKRRQKAVADVLEDLEAAFRGNNQSEISTIVQRIRTVLEVS